MRSAKVVLSGLMILAAFACASSHGSDGSAPTQQAEVTAPTSGLHISVALAAANLGDEGCAHDESAGVTLLSCAIRDGGPQGTGPCGGPCDLTQVQLSFSSGSGATSAHIQIASAALIDAMTGSKLQTLGAYTPLVWNGVQYVAWDESVPPSSQLRINYTISPPTWSTFDPTYRYNYSYPYTLELVIVVDGASVTLESTALTRPPPLST